MKNNNLSFLLIFFLFSIGKIQAQCPTGDIYITSQEDVDSFAVNYPGCTEILGSLRINNINDPNYLIDNLHGLSQITSIEGDLNIGAGFTGINNLTNLTGLDNLTSIGGSLLIGFRSWYDYYYYEYSDYIAPCSLTSLDGLNSLTSIGGSLSIESALDLADISALSSLTSVGENLYISNNNALTDLNGLNNLTDVGESLIFELINYLADISALSNLTSVGGELDICCNDVLTNLSGLDNLIELGELSIRGNAQLSDISSLGGLITIDAIEIENTPMLNNLLGLHNITDIMPGSLHIWNCNELTTLAGLESLTTIYSSLSLRNNTSLINLEGLNNLTTVNNGLSITGNNSLSSMVVLNNLTTITDLFIGKNDSLLSLNGLENLTNIDNRFSIWDNPALTDINALANLDSIGGELKIYDNPNLSFCTIYGVCNHLVNERPANIYNNLSGCNTEQEIQDACILLPIEMTTTLSVYLDGRTAILRWRTATETNNAGFDIQRSKDGINWEKIGWQNGQGTSTTSHIYAHRDTNPLSGISYYRLKQVDFDGQFDYSNVASLRYDKLESITVYPIPAKDVVIFDVPNIASADDIILYDITGREISRQAFPQDKQLTVSHLNDGVYIYRIFYEDEVYSGKIVVE